MSRHLDTSMTVLTAHLQIASMQLVRKWNGLLRTIADIGNVIAHPKIDHQKYDETNSASCCPTEFHCHVKTA